MPTRGAWTTDRIGDLDGAVAVVTGPTSGVGLVTARELAARGAHVVLAARDREKAKRTHDEIVDRHPGASLEIVDLDLASQDSVRRAAATIADGHPTVDILVNNAGIMATPFRRTVDGFELQFGVNHLGHWTFTAGLLPSLLAAPAARVVTVTSTARHLGRPVDPDDPHMEEGYDPWAAYGRSKLANFHFAVGLQRELDRRGLSAASLSAHPGLSRTNLQVRTEAEGGAGRSGPIWRWLAATVGMPPDRGALPQLRAATDTSLPGGAYVAPRYGMTGPPVRRRYRRRGLDGAIDTLWQVSASLTGVRPFGEID